MRRNHASPIPDSKLPTIYTVRAEDRIEANKIERDAWSVFLKWCHQVPEGTRVELLKHDKVCAWLCAAGTPVRAAVQSLHASPPPILA